tara:strand:+ start:7262 stop:9562 length:2301 start_codon:yes stop_codon:yes gene_type:complete
MDLQNRKAKSRKPKSQDKLVFNYETGDIDERTIHPEVQETRELWTQYNSSREPWAQKFQESIEFRAGAQWTKEQQEALEQRGQAAIVVNRIHPIVETAKALLTYNSPQFRATGREDSDRDTAKVFSDLFQYIWQISQGDLELKQAIDDYYVGGMGALMVYQDPDADMGKGEVKLKAVNPLDLYIDPNSKDKFCRDAAHIIYASYMTDEAATQMYPEFEDIIKDSAEEPEASDDYPITNLAKTVDQVFPGDVEDRAHTVRRYLERYTREVHPYYNVYEPFSEREFLYDYDEFEVYNSRLYVRVRKVTGEETIVWQDEAVEELLQVIEQEGALFHFALPPMQLDPNTGQPIPQNPIRVPGEEGPNAIPGSTTALIPITPEELKGLNKLTCNEVEVPRIKMVVSVGDSLLYERVLPVEDYPIVPIMNVHLRTPFPESDVRIYRPLQEYINKIRSLIIAHASTSTNVKLLIPRGSVDKRQVEEEWGRAGTSVIEFDAELGAPIVAGPVPLPNELYKNEADAKSDLEYGFGIYELMQGGGKGAPSTYRGTIVVDEFGQRRIKSRRDDIEDMLNQVGSIAVPLMQQLYTEDKVIRLVQPNGEETTQRFNFFKEMENGDVVKYHDIGVGRYDIQVVSGSTLPTNRMALLNTYMQMYQMGLIDQTEVLKKSELVDIDGVMGRAGQMQQMMQQMQAMQEELKKVKGDLQTAQREEVHAKKRLEVEKFSSKLDKVSNRADMASSLFQARLGDQQKQLMNSENSIEQPENLFEEEES